MKRGHYAYILHHKRAPQEVTGLIISCSAHDGPQAEREGECCSPSTLASNDIRTEPLDPLVRVIAYRIELLLLCHSRDRVASSFASLWTNGRCFCQCTEQPSMSVSVFIRFRPRYFSRPSQNRANKS